jgi:CRP-like cAMP-binding protein
MATLSPTVERLQKPQTYRRILLAAEILIVLGALLALLAVQNLTPITLGLFLVVAQTSLVLGVILYLAALLTSFLRHHGVSHVHFASGEIVFRQGDEGDFVYSIIDGQVEVVREESEGKEQVLRQMGPGEYFGEMALIRRTPRTATVRAVTEVNAVVLSQADFLALYTYLPDLHRSIEKVVQQRPVAPSGEG